MRTVARMNITMPLDILSELEKVTHPRGKSGYVTEAVEEKMQRERRTQAIKELSLLSPAFPHIKDGAKYISKMRKEDNEKREKKLHK